MKKTVGIFGSLTLLAGGAMASSYTTGFEAPDYANGTTLTGNNGWTELATGRPAGKIQGSTVYSGSQAVTLMRPADAPGSYGAVKTHTGIATTAENPTAIVEWDMRLLEGAHRSDVWGVSSLWGEFERFTLGVDQNNKVMVRNGQIGTVTTSYTVQRDQWNHFRMDLNYETKMGSAFINGTFLGTWQMLNGAHEHMATGLFNRAMTADDGAIFDGLSVTDNAAAPVPEPASIVAASVGFLALIRRKRTRK